MIEFSRKRVERQIDRARSVTIRVFRRIAHVNELHIFGGSRFFRFFDRQERGFHPIVTGYLELSSRQPKIIKHQTAATKIKTIGNNLYFLLNLYGESLLMKCLDLSNSLGVDWLAIEGYSDHSKQSPPFICDIDLPQDIAFQCA